MCVCVCSYYVYVFVIVFVMVFAIVLAIECVCVIIPRTIASTLANLKPITVDASPRRNNTSTSTIRRGVSRRSCFVEDCR